MIPYYYQANLLDRQSIPEQRLLSQFISLYERDIQNNILGKLPPDLVSMLGIDMNGNEVEYAKDSPPCLNQHVVARAKGFLPHVLIDGQDSLNPITEDLNTGDVVLLQYRYIRDLVINKAVDLI
jgi:hypothetical protein